MYVGHDPNSTVTPFRIDLKRSPLNVAQFEKPKNALGWTFDDSVYYDRLTDLDDASKEFLHRLVVPGTTTTQEVPQGAQAAIQKLLNGDLFVQKKVVIPEDARDVIRQLAAREIFEQTFLKYLVPEGKDEDDDEVLMKNPPLPRLDLKLLFCLANETPGIFSEKFVVGILDPVSEEAMRRENEVAFAFGLRSTQELHPLHVVLLLVDKENKPPSLPLVKAVYDANPAAVSSKVSGYQATPLAVACLKGCSLEVIQFLISKDPTAVSTPCEGNLYCLHFACFYCHDAVPLLLDKFEHAAKEEALVDHRREKLYPLDLAIQSGAPLAVVKRLYLTFPERVTDLNTHHAAPFFYALQYRPDDLEVVRFLYEQAPRSVHVERDEVTVFRAAACNQSPRVLEFILERAPPPVHLTWTFLHGAVFNNTPDAVTFLMEKWPWMMTTSFGDDGLPIHNVCVFYPLRLDILRALLDNRVDVLGMANGEGKLPLHMVCSRSEKCVDEAIRTVLQYSLEKCNSSDHDGTVFVDMQLECADKDGKIPLDCYLNNVMITRSQEIVEKLMVPEESFSRHTRKLLERWESSRSA